VPELSAQDATELRTGDRVQVRPISRTLDHLDGEWGTVTYVMPGVARLGGAAHVRMDLDSSVVCFGFEAIAALVRDV